MADVSIDHNCGCGFRTGRLEEAVKHSDTTHHSLTVHGTIRPGKESIERKAKDDLYDRLDALKESSEGGE